MTQASRKQASSTYSIDEATLAASLDAALQAARKRRSGHVASYIPELSRADPEQLAVAVCDRHGVLVEKGDSQTEFTIQSVAKPFVYGLALEKFGVEAVHQRVGVEPTGEAFDAILKLERRSRRPHNPMINAGAISVAGMFCVLPYTERLAVIQRLFEDLAGRKLNGVDYPTFLFPEQETGDRNRAMAHLMRHAEGLTEPTDDVLELYYQQCSLLVTTRDLAVMAGTLANDGRNPISGKQVYGAGVARHVLTVMTTCGLYDRSGQFLFDVGLPAKSGVSGALVAVAPGRLGLAAQAPPLDAKGNSVRAMAAVQKISKELQLHVLRPQPRRAAPAKPDIQGILAGLVETTKSLRDGTVADYLPAVQEDAMGIAVCSIDGEVFTAGDSEAAFTLQAIANPLVYALVREARGAAAVHRLAGYEPSGNAYHAIQLDRVRQKPYNPLGNAGAIAVSSLVPGENPGERLGFVLDALKQWCGSTLYVDSAVHAAEVEYGDRNRAIASLLRHFGLIKETEPALELYFQQCAMRTTCAQLAQFAAVLAAGGTAPGGRKRLIGARTVQDTLSLMFSCGFHDQSGRFVFDAGLPAKTGISGGIMAVAPGRWGMAVYSPRVNPQGTSVRGARALVRLANDLRLGIFDD